MALIAITQFGGEAPIFEEHQLPDQYATKAANLNLLSGALTPIYDYKQLTGVSLEEGTLTAYEALKQDGTTFWLQFKNYTVVAYVPEGEAATKRLVMSSADHEPRWGDTATLTSSGSTYPSKTYVLGVHPPITAPTVATSGGVAANENRTYVYTFVSRDGFESAPSPASAVVTAPSDATWTVTVPDLAPPNGGAVSAVSSSGSTHTLTLDTVYGLRAQEEVSLSVTGLTGKYRIQSVDSSASTITVTDSTATPSGTGTWSRVAEHDVTGLKKRLYRGVNGDYSLVVDATGAAVEVDASSVTMVDDSTTSLGEPLPLATQEMPPADLTQIRAMPNGTMVGIRKNEVCFSETGKFYSWPKEYRYGIEYEAVSVGVAGFAVVVATKGTPVVFSGSLPEAMTAQQLGASAPCNHPLSMVTTNNTAVFVCQFGLAMVDAGGVRILTSKLISPDKWATYLTKSITAVEVNNIYYMLYYNQDLAANAILAFDFKVPELGVMQYTRSGLLGITTNVNGSDLYVIVGGSLLQFNSNTALRIPYEWKSKRFVFPKPQALTAFQVRSTGSTVDQGAAQSAKDAQKATNLTYIQNLDTDGSFNGASLNAYSLNGSKVVPLDFVASTSDYITIEWYVEGVLKYSTTVKDSAIHRLPYLGKRDDYQIRVFGNMPLYRLIIGTNPTEIQRV